LARTGGHVRLYVADDLVAACGVELSPAQAHYVGHVLRMERGQTLHLFNGRHGEWAGVIDGLDRRRCSVLITQRCREQAAGAEPWLLFAPVKRTALDFIAAKATELGAGVLWPVITENTAVRRVNTDRIRSHAIEAAEQCGRITVPEVREPEPLARVLERWPLARRILLCDESGGGVPLAEALGQDGVKDIGAKDGGPWAVLTGPEGGFAESELDGLRKLPFVTAAGLGPRLLRADTAALSALACWQALVGDWRRPLS
jgi:16S rRNA (uracil1498-N3)-methyltransferase